MTHPPRLPDLLGPVGGPGPPGAGSVVGPDEDGRLVIEATHTLEDEFRTPDRVRAHVVEQITAEGLDLVDDLHTRGKQSEIIEDCLLDLHASSRDHRSFESWCHQDLPLALDSVRTDLKPTLWAWKQLVDSVREDLPF
jgi:hypothetical protein